MKQMVPTTIKSLISRPPSALLSVQSASHNTHTHTHTHTQKTYRPTVKVYLSSFQPGVTFLPEDISRDIFSCHNWRVVIDI